MPYIRPIFAAAILGAAFPLLAQSDRLTAQGTAPANADVSEVLATLGSQRITLTDVRARIGTRLDQVEAEYLRARSQAIGSALETILRERLFQEESQRQGKSVEQLLAEAAGPSGFEPSDAEITAWYAENQSQVGGRPLEQVRAQVATRIQQQRRREAAQNLDSRLRQERGVVIHFQPYRFAFDNAGAPFLGSADAPVTIVEFSDFECPFCARFAPALKRLAQEFGNDVFIVYRQFPITSIHRNAFKAAEASLCAHDQDKFWQLHDLMFAEQDQLAPAALKNKAGRLGLDQQRFDGCLDSGRFAAQVQSDFQEGQLAGISGTPTLFINGVVLAGGAVPYETIAAAVRRALDTLQRR